MGNALVRIREPEKGSLTAEKKERELLTRLAERSAIIVALSGGADSAYLAWAAQAGVGRTSAVRYSAFAKLLDV